MVDFSGVRLLAFRVADIVFATDAAVVREILPAQPSTRIPGAGGAVRGLINARGSLITVIDGCAALGYPSGGEDCPIIVFEICDKTVGFSVDTVLDLFSVTSDKLTERKDLPGIDARLVLAVGYQGGVSFVLLDVETLLGPIMAG